LPPVLGKEKTTFGCLSRSELMSRIRSRGNVSTEARLLRLLRAERLGGWRRHLPLPGSPDFAWRREKIAVFVDGCFWHGHDCGKNIKPRHNAEAWQRKIRGNRRRDRRVYRELRRLGWRVLRIFECQLSKRPEACVRRIVRLLKADETDLVVSSLPWKFQ
jgi:DNA mismatch endonuclease (patch repair protein)